MVAATIWSGAYLVIWASGQRFSTAYLTYGWQLVPFETLRSDPFGSVWYLHTQPPLWNLLLGAVARWSWAPVAVSLQLLLAVAGGALAGTLAAMCRRLGASVRLSIVAALAATLNTEVMAMLFSPQYELPVALALALMAWTLALPANRWTDRHTVLLMTLATAVVMTRAVFHPVWLVLVGGLIVLGQWPQMRPRAAIAGMLVPVVVVGGWMLKNEILFGRATLSSWSGMNMQRAVVPVLPADELDRLVAAGELSMVASVGAFQEYAAYEPYVEPCTPDHKHPAVSEPVWAEPIIAFGIETEVTNFNYECFLPVYEEAGRDAWYAAVHRPGVWWEGRVWATRAWFTTNPSVRTSPSVVMRQLDAVGRIARFEVPVRISTSSWSTPVFGPATTSHHLSITAMVATVVVVAAGIHRGLLLVRQRRPGGSTSDSGGPDDRLVCVFVAMTACWTFVVGVVGELGEQSRFRVMTDPLVVTLAILLCVATIRRRWAR